MDGILLTTAAHGIAVIYFSPAWRWFGLKLLFVAIGALTGLAAGMPFSLIDVRIPGWTIGVATLAFLVAALIRGNDIVWTMRDLKYRPRPTEPVVSSREHPLKRLLLADLGLVAAWILVLFAYREGTRHTALWALLAILLSVYPRSWIRKSLGRYAEALLIPTLIVAWLAGHRDLPLLTHERPAELMWILLMAIGMGLFLEWASSGPKTNALPTTLSHLK